MSPVIQDAKNPSTNQNFTGGGSGYLPPTPDARDYSPSHPKIMALEQALGINSMAEGLGLGLPAFVDLREWFTPIENQGMIGSCSAHAVVGIVEYFQKREHGKYFNGSRRFVYKVSRKLSMEDGDCGAQLRRALGALAIFGVPDENYWHYTDWPYSELDPKEPNFKLYVSRNHAIAGMSSFDDEPTPFVYTMAARNKINSYFCHDPLTESRAPADVLASVKKWLAAGVPSVFGFDYYDNSFAGVVRSEITFPSPSETSTSGHAVVAVGYDDNKVIGTGKGGSIGALLFRNSWGPDWGDNGYGWLPYRYVLEGHARDFWSITDMDWLDTSQFGLYLEDDKYIPPPPIEPSYGTFRVTVSDGVRIRSTPDITSDLNIIKRGSDTKDRVFSYDMNTIQFLEKSIWVQVWQSATKSDLGDYQGWMCVKMGNDQYTDFKF